MADVLRFHVLLLPNVDWAELRERVVRLESLGIEVAALPDHLVDWSRPVSPWFESWTALAGLAEATTTIRLASSVTQITLRNPAMLARQVLTLDHVSGGRIELGLGTGLLHDPSYAMTGLPDWEVKERVDRFEEYVEIVRRLLTDEVTTFDGHFYRIDGAIMNPRPMQTPRPPIAVAALGPRMMRIAARFADVWDSMSFLTTFDEQLAETRERCEAIEAACAAVGRDPATLGRSYLMFDAGARPRGGAIGYYESVGRFEDEVGRIRALGIDDIGMYYPLDPSQVPTFERIATDVLPRLRG
jgi:alkanesulfonate monooxygenase SsuD/methylene tetrahydromethanopterin reductase-like flavin-dependent oxidoreductase (luciferase family)